MKSFTLPLAIALLVTCVATGQSQTARDRCTDPSDNLSRLVSDYKILRARRAALAAGVFDRDVSASGGKLEEVMSKLGFELGRPPFKKDDIVACLGDPDAIKTNDNNPFFDIYKKELEIKGKTLQERSDREFLIYHWRGWHDFLFFISEDGVIVDHGWWFAYE